MSPSRSDLPALASGAPTPDWLAGFFDQTHRLVRIETAAGGATLVVERVQWREALDDEFAGTVDCLSLSAHLDLDALVGTEATLRRQTDDGERAWHGLVMRAAARGADGGLARYRLMLAPWTALLDLRRDSHVWQDQTAREIIEDVFADHPQAHWRWEATAELAARPVCIQYRETDLAFVRRLLAEEGLNFRYAHDDDAPADGAHARHALVVFDADAELPDLGTLRYARHGARSTLGVEGADAITTFGAMRLATPNAVARASWDPRLLRATGAQAQSAQAPAALPALEDHDAAAAWRYADADAAQAAADRRLAAHERAALRHAGAGTVRRLAAGARFALADHPDPGPEGGYVLTAVTHRIANNLASTLAPDADALEAGGFDVRFVCVPASVRLVPPYVPKPSALGPQVALVVGREDAALTTDRELRVRVQFPWDRRAAEGDSGANPSAAAPNHGDAVLGRPSGAEAHGVWVRVAQALAGPNWGAAFTPRIGTEVLVDFEHADIDRPLVVGCLHNPADIQPWPAGADSPANHPGTVSGVHLPTLDGAGWAQWLHDDATGQLRLRLGTSAWTSRLELGHAIAHGPTASRRGAWRGEGFEFATRGWGVLRAGEGWLVSTTARERGRGTALDAAEARAQLTSARRLGQALSDMARAQGGAALATQQAQGSVATLIDRIDPAGSGKYAGAVAGQDATQPTAEARSGGAPVARLGAPVVLLDAAADALAATPASVAAHAGEHASLAAQGDWHAAAGHGFAAVAGQAARWITHAGGINAIAAQGPLSVRAHTDALALQAQGAVTVTSSAGAIRIEAHDKITLLAGEAAVTLEGGDITFACPGTFSVKGAGAAFVGPASQSAALPALPQATAHISDWIALDYRDQETGEGVAGAGYEIHFKNGPVLAGTLDAQGCASHEDIERKEVAKVVYKPRTADQDKPHAPLSDLLG